MDCHIFPRVTHPALNSNQKVDPTVLSTLENEANDVAKVEE